MAVTEKTRAIDQAILQIEKQFGKGSIMKLGANPGDKVDAIPSGSLALDLALGIGGYPPGPGGGVYRPGGLGKNDAHAARRRGGAARRRNGSLHRCRARPGLAVGAHLWREHRRA